MGSFKRSELKKIISAVIRLRFAEIKIANLRRSSRLQAQGSAVQRGYALTIDRPSPLPVWSVQARKKRSASRPRRGSGTRDHRRTAGAL